MKTPHALFIVTGLSGAGLSSTLKTLEDLGAKVFDNFPIGFLPNLLNAERNNHNPIAIGIDTRTRGFNPQDILKTIDDLRAAHKWTIKTIFLTADDHVLLRRFTDTRRVHPMARDRAVSDGIATEKALLYPLKYKSDLILDTSELNIHDLRRIVESHISSFLSDTLHINVMSFSFRHGLPREADLVFDMRFLSNPHWKEEFRHLTGLDKPIQEYIEQDPAFHDFFESTGAMIQNLIPRYKDNGKRYLTIAFGCTGGQHRSVYSAQKMAGRLKSLNHPVTIHHRELKS